jgi:transitional endoplasmic reticulum ATPase
VHLKDKPVAPDVDSADLAARTPGFTGAEIAAACRRAATMAVRRAVGSDGRPAPGAQLQVMNGDLLTAIEEIQEAG